MGDIRSGNSLARKTGALPGSTPHKNRARPEPPPVGAGPVQPYLASIDLITQIPSSPCFWG